MKNLVLSLLIGISLMSFVIAQGQGIHEPGTGIIDPEINEAGQGLETNTQNQGEETNLQNQFKIRDGNYIGENGQQIKIKKQSNNKIQLEVGSVKVNCDCNITQEQFQNKTRLKAILSNGKNAEIKVMPDTASETALQKLRLKNCNESNNCSIELKEVGQKEQAKLAYEIKTQRQSKVFGLFKTKMQVQVHIDAETGEVINVKKPWWAFLASEPTEE